MLGPLQVLEDGRAVPLGGLKQRGVLAVLLLERNRVVPRDRLVDAPRADEPPASAANSVQVYVSKLRKLLGEDGGLATEQPGYILRVASGAVDIEEFERLLAEGKAALRSESFAVAEASLARALALWRGPALADLASEPFVHAEIARLEGLRLEALDARFEAMLSVGREAEAVGELQALVGLHPLDERFRGQLMVALYRSGRQAEALEAYRTVRRSSTRSSGSSPPRAATARAGNPAAGRLARSRYAPLHGPRPNEARRAAGRPPRRPHIGSQTRSAGDQLFADIVGRPRSESAWRPRRPRRSSASA